MVDGYWQERGGRQNLPSLCRCCGQITIWSTWSFVRSKWPALESISSASLSPDFDRWQVSRWAVIVSWHSCTFISWEKPRELPHVIFLLSLKLHDSKFMLKLFLLNEICVRAHFATKWLWHKVAVDYGLWTKERVKLKPTTPRQTIFHQIILTVRGTQESGETVSKRKKTA